ncbi:MAG: ester cyclase [Anaerolineales bacterium]|nr:ester cyclase [Anaerolineales bacterium]MCB8991456.1 ester cyclase [Ardenticatenaceae bacterium]MCB9003924.1 ester cyclase [Ardenticatenaceae bacterium]
MQTQEAAHNRQIALQLVDGNTAVPLSPTVILQDHAQSASVSGQEAVATFLHTFFRDAFVEVALEIHTLLADRETATLSLSFSGRQIAPFWGLPCTGRFITLSLAFICRFHARQIVKIELYYDAGTLLRQLGLAL